jgi:hypothetical protein
MGSIFGGHGSSLCVWLFRYKYDDGDSEKSKAGDICVILPCGGDFGDSVFVIMTSKSSSLRA